MQFRIIVSLLLFCSVSQTQPSTKDALAVESIRLAYARNGVTVLPTDSVATGTLSVGGRSYRVEVQTQGTKRVRSTLIGPDGKTITRILNDGYGAMVRESSTRYLIGVNTLADRVTYIPWLSLLSEYASPSVTVQRNAPAKLDGPEEIVLAVTGSEIPAEFKPALSRTFHLDRENGLPVALEYTTFDEHGSESKSQIRIEYSDYRNVKGIPIPFMQKTYIDGVLAEEFILESITFNSGVDAGQFELPARSERQ